MENVFVQSEIARDNNMRISGRCDELPGNIAKLAKPPYGLKQIVRLFEQFLMFTIYSFGRVRCKSDSCIFRLTISLI